MGYFSGVVPLRGQVNEAAHFQNIYESFTNPQSIHLQTQCRLPTCSAIGERPSPKHNPFLKCDSLTKSSGADVEIRGSHLS